MGTTSTRIGNVHGHPMAGGAALDMAPPQELGLDVLAWWSMIATGADVLIQGESAALARVLSFAWPRFQKPVFCCDGRRMLLPPHTRGTLVIQAAHELSVSEQERLLGSMDAGSCRVRIVATASPDLSALVQSG